MNSIVRFYHISDIHLEFHKTTDLISVVTPHDSTESVLILNGDIGMVDKPYRRGQYNKFLSLCSKCFKHVICTRGNHEAFGGDFNRAVDKLRDMCSNYANVYFLENEDVIIEDVKIFGAPFFTDFGGDDLSMLACKEAYNDFRKVRTDSYKRKLHPNDYIKEYRRSVMACVKSDPDIVVSHYLPSLNLLERHTGVLDGGMGGEPLEAILNGGLEDVKYWVYGHDHSRKVTTLGDVTCVSNCRGYLGDKIPNRVDIVEETVKIDTYFDFVKDW